MKMGSTVLVLWVLTRIILEKIHSLYQHKPTDPIDGLCLVVFCAPSSVYFLAAGAGAAVAGAAAAGAGAALGASPGLRSLAAMARKGRLRAAVSQRAPRILNAG